MTKRKKWKTTTIDELFDLSDADRVLVGLRASLAIELQRARRRKKLSQQELAELIGTSQPQVSKMEAGQSSVTIDRMIRALAELGLTRNRILRAMGAAA